MNLEQTYQYMKDRYGITHSFPRFVENAEKKGLTKENQYLELIVSVLVSMKLYEEAVSEVIEEAVRESLDDTLALETHIRGLELDYEELQGKYSELLKLSEMDGMELLAKVQSLKKLVRELRAKKDPEPHKKLERENKQLKEELRRLEISYNHVQQQRNIHLAEYAKLAKEKQHVINNAHSLKKNNKTLNILLGIKWEQIFNLQKQVRDWQRRYNKLKLEELEKENKKFTNKLRKLFKKKS
ncbi:hypothetical protein [Paraglaciecola chathamensis]|uniref:hypothetical protein n=1 Tax=Paraglaciecola chathamensis TaxID=368405 RepID=UPI00363A80BB